MASTLLEQTRAGHEELERLERAVVRDFKAEARTHKERLQQNHRVRKAIDAMQARAAALASEMTSDDGARKEEIAALKGDDPLETFYERWKEVRDYHLQYPSTDITEAEDLQSGLPRGELHVEFSGEEALGRHLDLHSHFHRFVNSKFGRQQDYLTYVSSLDNFAEISRHLRMSKPYREYLADLLTYLEGFWERTQPLQGLAKQYKPLTDGFEAEWEAGQVAGWEDRGQGATPDDTAAGALDVEAFDSVEELEHLGAERLKEALAALGLKAGGTLQQRAERLFATKGKTLDQIDRKLFAKGVIPAGARSAAEVARQRAAAKEAALLEAKVARLCSVLGPVLEDTKANIEKKQARTFEELQAEQEEAEAELAEEESDEEDEFIYNPLKLPLGWDGKPIPYWLYKLHGLNQEFKCEICGEASYWGRRAFERHFKEWRHQNGMRALGIPNNKLFYEVTSIKDAKELWSNVKEREKGGFRAEMEEEYEDADGNVYSKKTYELLKRQGII